MSDKIANDTTTPQEILHYIRDFIINLDLKPSEDADIFVSMIVMPLSKFYTTHEKMKQIILKHDNLAAASALQTHIDKSTNVEWNTVSELYGALATGKMKIMFPQRPNYLWLVASWGTEYKLMTKLGYDEFSKTSASLLAIQEIKKWSNTDWMELAFGLEKVIPELREMVDIVDSATVT